MKKLLLLSSIFFLLASTHPAFGSGAVSLYGSSGITALTGDVTASGPGSAAASISAATVTGKALTGFVSGAGTVGATDTILQGFNKVVGNIALLAPLASPALTGTATLVNSTLSGTSRFGTNAIISTAQEQSSFLNSISSVPSSIPYALFAQSQLTSNSASTTAGIRAMGVNGYRIVTADVTDTQGIIGFNSKISIDVDSGHTYTSSSSTGVSPITVSALVKTGTGALAFPYSAIQFISDTGAVTGHKTGIRFNSWSGGTSNAFIADNDAYTGNFFINQSGSSASVLGGALTLNSTFLAPSLATSSAATTGTLCWTTGTGNVNVDTTVACLASTRKVKKDIEPLNTGLSTVMKLKPVSYQRKAEFNPQHNGREVGFIAEDVQKVDERLVAADSKGEVFGVRYMQYTAVLTKAIQEQQREIVMLKKRLSQLEQE